jgi:hypothetical protein
MPRLPGVRTPLAWTVFGAFALHNAEEAVTAPACSARMSGRLPIPWPAPWAVQPATALVTSLGSPPHGRRGAPVAPRPGDAAGLRHAGQRVVPHVPLAVWSGGYAPAW